MENQVEASTANRLEVAPDGVLCRLCGQREEKHSYRQEKILCPAPQASGKTD